MHFYIERQIGLHSVKNKAIKNTYHLLIDSMTTIVKLFRLGKIFTYGEPILIRQSSCKHGFDMVLSLENYFSNHCVLHFDGTVCVFLHEGSNDGLFHGPDHGD